VRHGPLFASNVTVLQLSPIDNRRGVRYSGTEIRLPRSSAGANRVRGRNCMTTTTNPLHQAIRAFFIGVRLLSDLLEPRRSPVSICVAVDSASLGR